MEMLLNEELEPELGLTGKQILLPDCLLQPIEIKPSEKAGLGTKRGARRKPLEGLPPRSFPSLLRLPIGAVADAEARVGKTASWSTEGREVKENGHLCPENGTGIGTYKKLPDFVI
ncbi:Protein phosphatase 2A regulatory B subunit (B56 family) [Musa troglodytarum]|uniref:Protein phosphatase 2A regulatory B subunit (B56 family) n=1 Tax=Musa troglodytarum TaxID=320322 RepID=A0A9E7KR08_9LILI|nr:Protein phosphatase 2A regulatory B subunit (B56 family) [Musa troglodytarum]